MGECLILGLNPDSGRPVCRVADVPAAGNTASQRSISGSNSFGFDGLRRRCVPTAPAPPIPLAVHQSRSSSQPIGVAQPHQPRRTGSDRPRGTQPCLDDCLPHSQLAGARDRLGDEALVRADHLSNVTGRSDAPADGWLGPQPRRSRSCRVAETAVSTWLPLVARSSHDFHVDNPLGGCRKRTQPVMSDRPAMTSTVSLTEAPW